MLWQIAERLDRQLERVVPIALVVEPVAIEAATMDDQMPQGQLFPA